MTTDITDHKKHVRLWRTASPMKLFHEMERRPPQEITAYACVCDGAIEGPTTYLTRAAITDPSRPFNVPCTAIHTTLYTGRPNRFYSFFLVNSTERSFFPKRTYPVYRDATNATPDSWTRAVVDTCFPSQDGRAQKRYKKGEQQRATDASFQGPRRRCNTRASTSTLRAARLTTKTPQGRMHTQTGDKLQAILTRRKAQIAPRQTRT